MLKKLGTLAAVSLIAAGCATRSRRPQTSFTSDSQNLNVIPKPLQVKAKQGSFTINEDTLIYCKDDPEISRIAEMLTAKINRATGFSLPIIETKPAKGASNFILLGMNPEKKIGNEAYRLFSSPKAVFVMSKTPQGLFWGTQTLMQLLPTNIESDEYDNGGAVDWSIPAVSISDQPRFKYRGMHLDVGRHMFSVAEIKRYIDYLAMHKLNTFHWHLTEDQGWRIEIKKYPKLTTVGATRAASPMKGNRHQLDGKQYGPLFYTQEEVKEIVKYASDRFITVIPEIEMPGHSMGALAAYPHLGCTGGPYKVRCFWGVEPDIYCAGNEEAFTFLEDVLKEVMELFPSEYIHIGGDEAPKARWKKCAKCQQRIKDEGLKDEHELQSYFIRRMEKFLNNNGRKLIGWDEILEGGLAPNATVMSWRGVRGGIAAAKAGRDCIMTPNNAYYFDHYQGKRESEPEAIGGYSPLDQVYTFEPVPAALNAEEAKRVIGIQANCWTEYMRDFKQVEYMVLPRMAALAETAWTKKELKDWNDFSERMSAQFDRYSRMGANYRIPAPYVSSSLTTFTTQGFAVLESDNNMEIYYTLDGSEPDHHSEKYTKPLKFSESAVLKAKCIDVSGHESAALTLKIQKMVPLDPTIVDSTEKGLMLKYIEAACNEVADLLDKEAKAEGVALKIGLPKSRAQDNFGLIYEGYIEIPEDGIYTFYTKSDDGSTLSVGNIQVVDNDGPHGAEERAGSIALKAGLHPFKLAYFELDGAESLDVYIAGPGMEKQEIPATMLKH